MAVFHRTSLLYRRRLRKFLARTQLNWSCTAANRRDVLTHGPSCDVAGAHGSFPRRASFEFFEPQEGLSEPLIFSEWHQEIHHEIDHVTSSEDAHATNHLLLPEGAVLLLPRP